MFNLYAKYTDEQTGFFKTFVGSFNSQSEAEAGAVLFEDNLGYCGNFAGVFIKQESVEDLACDLAEMLRHDWTMKQAKEEMGLTESLWMDVVGEYCSNCE